MRLIEKKKVRDELERRARHCELLAGAMLIKENKDYYRGKAEAYREMISFLEPPSLSGDLEKDAMDYYLADTMNEAHYAEGGQIVPRAINDAYIAGRLAEREKMMKKAVDVVVWDAGVEFAPHPCISVEDFNLKDGDKVKLIIVKED